MATWFGRFSGTAFLFFWSLSVLTTHSLFGQAPAPAAPGAAPATAPAAPPAGAPVNNDTISPPEETILEQVNSVENTDVPIHLTYFPGTRGKETVPVILLHMFKGDRHEMEGLALYLQKQGHAVFVPDLRGHGQSINVVNNNIKLDAATMLPAQFANMVTKDMNCVKRFLVKKHNAGELNADKIVIVGAELGSIVAVNWSALDWAAQDLQGLKQSKDVKALVLLSPVQTIKGLTMAQALGFEPISKILSFFLIVGAEDSPGLAQVKTIHQRLERARPKPTKPEEKTVFLAELKTRLIGSKLLGEKSLGVENLIAQFIQARAVDQVYPWKSREAAAK
jgi:pimeloyl-ACP methyl ester carboxylesterase